MPHVQRRRRRHGKTEAGVRDAPCPRAEEKVRQDRRGGETVFRIKPIPTRDAQRAQTNLVHTRTQRPHRDKTELCLSVSCGGTGQQLPAQGHGLWVQQNWIWHKPSWRRSPMVAKRPCPFPPSDRVIKPVERCT